MSIPPSQWGPYLWYSLHYVSLGYPNNPTNEQKQIYKNYFLSYQTILPCSICAEHYKENLKRVPLTDEIMSDKEKLIAWVINLHNEVNVMKGKEIVPFDQARSIVESYKNDCSHKFAEDFTNTDNSSNTKTFCCLLILLGLVGIAIIYKKN